MFLVVGLGNPGPQYCLNRHNIGFLAIDVLVDSYGFRAFQSAHQGVMAQGRIDTVPVIAFKPLTYMNLSGNAVGAIQRFYKISTEKIIVVHDDLDIPFGEVRLKKGGGHGGHNGLKSLDQHLGVEYWRVRFGIGHPGDRNQVSNYVLSNFTAKEQDIVAPLLQEFVRSIPLLFGDKQAEFVQNMKLANGT